MDLSINGGAVKLIRSRRGTLSVEIKNGEAIVRAPIFLPRGYIERFLHEKSDWIEKKLSQSKPSQDRAYGDDEQFLFFGKTYKLKMFELSSRAQGAWRVERQANSYVPTRGLSPERGDLAGQIASPPTNGLAMTGINYRIELDGGKLSISTKEYDPKYIKKLIENYYLKLTREVAEKFLQKYEREFDFNEHKTVYKFYRSKWGSCSRDSLCFNGKLSMAPMEVIEYVVIHELCHLRHKNHSKRFWAEVARYDPLYKTHRKWLNKNNQNFML
jgi:predicted metal-dependent hydrolase